MGSRIESKNARSLSGYLISSTPPTDGQALLYDLASNSYIPTTIPSHALVSGNGTTFSTDRYNLGGTLTAPAIITDGRGTPTGIEYGGDYSATYTNRSLVDKGYVANLVSSSKAYQGGYDANGNVPDLDVTPIAGIKAGFQWDVTSSGSFFGVEPLEIGDTVTARIDNPTILADWVIGQTNLTPASIKVQYESNANTNAYTDAAKTKVDYISVTAAIDLDAIPNGNLATMGAYTLKGNNTNGSATPTDIGRTDPANNLPVPGDLVLGWTAAGALSTFVAARFLNTMALGTTSAGSSTPQVDSSSLYYVSAQAQPIVVNAPGGTPVESQEYEFRFRDDGTARAITWNAAFTAPGTASLPTTTVAGETMFLRFLYNATTAKWELASSSNSAGGGPGSDTDAIHDNVSGEIAAITAKATPVNADVLLIEDSAASNAKKKITFENLKNTINASGKPSLSKTILIEEPTATEDLTIFYTDVAITIQEIRTVSTGTTPSTTIQIKTSSLDRGGAGTNITTAAATTSTSLGDTASVTTASVPSGSWIWLVTTAASGTSVGLTVNIRYTED